MKLRPSKPGRTITKALKRTRSLEFSPPRTLTLGESSTEHKDFEVHEQEDYYDLGSPLTSFPSSPEEPIQKASRKPPRKATIIKTNKTDEIIGSTIRKSTLAANSSTEVKTKKRSASTSKKKVKELQDPDTSIDQKQDRRRDGKKSKHFIPISPPSTWEEVFLKIQAYRQTHLAPVDSMGCERTDAPDFSPKEFRFYVLVSLMLSSQTKDEETHAAMCKLRKAGGGKLTAEILDAMDENVLHDCIRQVGFHNTKTRYVKNAARICLEKYDGDIPSTIKDLMSLPGVGPKMAFLAMQCGWDVNVGIGVDVHVHRITNRLGWVETKTPEETRVSLESWLPEKWWKAINFLLVGLGQTVCYANRPRCYACPVAEFCPSRDSNSLAPAAGKPLPRIRSAEPRIKLEIEPSQEVERRDTSHYFSNGRASSDDTFS